MAINKFSKIPYSISKRSSQFSTVNVPKYYANLQYNGKVDLDGLAEHMTEHGSVYKKGDILAILTNMVQCVKEMLLLGYKVELSDLGTFSNKIKSVGAGSASDFYSANIARLSAKFSVGTALKDYKDEAEFEYVPLRKNQQLLNAAEKGGAEMMSLYRTDNNGGGGDDDEDPEIIGQ